MNQDLWFIPCSINRINNKRLVNIVVILLIIHIIRICFGTILRCVYVYRCLHGINPNSDITSHRMIFWLHYTRKIGQKCVLRMFSSTNFLHPLRLFFVKNRLYWVFKINIWKPLVVGFYVCMTRVFTCFKFFVINAYYLFNWVYMTITCMVAMKNKLTFCLYHIIQFLIVGTCKINEKPWPLSCLIYYTLY